MVSVLPVANGRIVVVICDDDVDDAVGDEGSVSGGHLQAVLGVFLTVKAPASHRELPLSIDPELAFGVSTGDEVVHLSGSLRVQV